jgi:hypothetical protein
MTRLSEVDAGLDSGVSGDPGKGDASDASPE